MVADLGNDAREAETRYKRVLDLPEYAGSHKRAKRYLSESYSTKK